MLVRKYMKLIIAGALLLSCYSQLSESLKILGIFPLNGKSHFVMIERLAKGLAEKGHQIDVYSYFPLKDPIPNYKDFSLVGSSPKTQNNVTYDDVLSFQFLNISTLMNTVGTNICDIMNLPIFQDLKNSKQDPPYDVVIVETFLFNCYIAWGRYFNAPLVGVMTSRIFSWFEESLGNPSMPEFLFSEDISQITFIQRLSNFVFEKMTNEFFKYSLQKQNKFIKQYFGADYPDAIELQKDIDLLLVNIHFSLEGVRARTPSVIPVGGLHIKDDDTKLSQEVKKWLDGSKSGCIYFSFGSMVRIETFSKDFINKIYTSFKNIIPVRVLMKIAEPNELPAGLPSNVMTQSWVSQEKILQHKNTKLFITHGGMMGIQESIYYAVPMIVMPLFGDQPLNAKFTLDQKISKVLSFNNLTEVELTSSIKEVLYNNMYKKNIENLSKRFKDRPMKPLDTAIYWIEYIARHGKKSLKPVIVDLPWWKVNCLDIYVFLLFVVCLTLYIVILIMKKCYSVWKNPFNSASKKLKKLK